MLRRFPLLPLLTVVCLGACLPHASAVARAEATPAPAGRSDSVRAGERITLRLGQSVLLRVEDPLSVVVDRVRDTEILEVTALRRQKPTGPVDLMLVGKAVGVTTLRVREARGLTRYEVEVQPRYADLEDRVRRALGAPGVKVQLVEGSLVLSGEVDSPEQAAASEKVALLFHPTVLNLLHVRAPEKPVEVPPPAPSPEELAETLRAAIAAPEVSVRVVNDAAVLEGRVDTHFESRKAEAIAKRFTGSVINALTVNEPLDPIGSAEGEASGAERGDGTAPTARPLPSREELAREIERAIGIATVRAEVTWGVAGHEPPGPLFASRAAAGRESPVSDRSADSSRLHGSSYPNGFGGLLGGQGPSGTPNDLREAGLALGSGAPIRGLSEARPASPRYPNMTVILRGSVADQIELEKAYRVAGLYAVPLNLLTVERRLHAKLRLKILEIEKGALKDLGIDWQIGQTQTLTEILPGPRDGRAPSPFRVGAIQRTTPLNVDAVITALVERDQARLLAEPTQLAESGGTAIFQVGGFFPVPRVVAGVLGSTPQTDVQFVPFGVILQMAPLITDNRQVRLKMQVQVSSLDRNNGAVVAGTLVPAIRSRSTESDLTLRPGETLTLGGLFQQEEAALARKLPLLGDLPILGSLFRSKRFQKRETELVILVTPEIE